MDAGRISNSLGFGMVEFLMSPDDKYSLHEMKEQIDPTFFSMNLAFITVTPSEDFS